MPINLVKLKLKLSVRSATLVKCDDFIAGRCHSCRSLDQVYSDQLINKQLSCERALAFAAHLTWLPIQVSPEIGFRNKAKMVVSGHWREPILGINHLHGQSVDLTMCPLYPVEFQNIFKRLKEWITLCKLMPYSIAQRTGNLKFVLVSYSQSTQSWMIRWVLRSHHAISTLRHYLPDLLAVLPAQTVVSVNIQPIDMAIVEGEEEIVLTEAATLCYCFNNIPLLCRPKSFFQTNDAVASQLYAQAQCWVKPLAPQRVWDLFCGVGGFALHLAQVLPYAQITGIEISTEAIESAKLSAHQIGCHDRTTFRALTAQDFSLASHQQNELPDGVVVNPPRRGLGRELSLFLNNSTTIDWIVYSSCSVDSLAKDLTQLSQFTPVTAQAFDMFPHTQHVEVLVLLMRHQKE